MSTLGTWDKITGALGSTTSAFGGGWGNFISDLFNGEDIGLIDPTKKPNINTEFRFRNEKLRLFDVDDSHQVTFYIDDIDVGPTRKVKIRRMNTPFEDDYMMLEGMPQTSLNKTIDSTLNTVKNIGKPLYEVFFDGTNWKARNTKTGIITSSNSTFTTVLQAAINALTASRSVQEVIEVRGVATPNTIVTIPSYTVLDLTAAKLTLANSTATHMFINSDTSGGNTQIKIIGGIIDGNKANQAATPGDEDTRNIFQFTKVTNSSISKCYIINASARAIRFNDCINCTAEFNTVLDSGGEGIQSKDGSDIKFSYNTVKSTGYSNITTYGTEDALIEGNYCDDTVSTTTSGINISSVRNKVIGNTVRNPGGACVFLAESGSTYDASGVQVIGNILSGSGDNCGIVGAGYPLTGAIISNNIVFGNFDEGIRFSGAHKNIMIDNNLVYLNGGSGIYVSGTVSTSAVATHVKISDNICSNNGTAASVNNYDRAGITARGTDTSGVVDIVIKNNTCYDDQGSPTQKYGVYIQNSLNSLLELNNLKNNQTDGIISTTNSGLRLFENNGYASDTPIATTTGTETFTNKTLTAPVINAATITGAITLDSTSANYVELVKPFTNSSAESILKIRLSEDTGSFFAFDNATGTNAILAPLFYGRNASSNAVHGLTVTGQVHTSFDSGTKAALGLNATTHAGAALGVRPILDIESAGTAEYTFSTAALDMKNNNLVSVSYEDFTKMTAPANPGANDIRLYVDTADTRMKIRNNAGTVVDLHGAGDLYQVMKTKTIVGELDVQDAAWGSGMFTKIAAAIGNSQGSGSDSGVYRYYGTGTTSGTKTGNVTSNAVFRRQWKPHFYCVFKAPTTTTNFACFIGMSTVTDASELHITAPLPTPVIGIGLYVATNLSNIQIASNDGTSTATLIDTGKAKTELSAWRSIEISNPADDGNWLINYDNGSYTTTVTSDVPAQSTAMYGNWHAVNNTTTDMYLYIGKLMGKETFP